MTVIVARYVDPIEAQIAAGLLQAEGIAVHLGDQNMALANWEWRLAIGGVKLHVRDDQLAHAREVIRRLDAGEFALPPDATEHEHDDSTPIEVPTGAAPNRESWSSRLAWVALVLFAIPLPWRRRRR